MPGRFRARYWYSPRLSAGLMTFVVPTCATLPDVGHLGAGFEAVERVRRLIRRPLALCLEVLGKSGRSLLCDAGVDWAV